MANSSFTLGGDLRLSNEDEDEERLDEDALDFEYYPPSPNQVQTTPPPQPRTTESVTVSPPPIPRTTESVTVTPPPSPRTLVSASVPQVVVRSPPRQQQAPLPGPSVPSMPTLDYRIPKSKGNRTPLVRKTRLIPSTSARPPWDAKLRQVPPPLPNFRFVPGPQLQSTPLRVLLRHSTGSQVMTLHSGGFVGAKPKVVHPMLNLPRCSVAVPREPWLTNPPPIQ